MLTGTVAFDSSATASEVLLAQAEIESPEGISARSAALLSQGLLVVDPEERMTIDDVFDHPFCRSVVRPDVTNAEPLTDVVSEAGLTADQLARLQGGAGGEGSSAAGSGDDETAEEGAAADAAEASAEDQAATTTTTSAAGAARQGGGDNDAAAPAGGQGAGTNNGEVSAVDGASDPGNQSDTPTGRSATAQGGLIVCLFCFCFCCLFYFYFYFIFIILKTFLFARVGDFMRALQVLLGLHFLDARLRATKHEHFLLAREECVAVQINEKRRRGALVQQLLRLGHAARLRRGTLALHLAVVEEEVRRHLGTANELHAVLVKLVNQRDEATRLHKQTQERARQARKWAIEELF